MSSRPDHTHSLKLNRYNVRAVRQELDSYIRSSSWKKFRVRFSSLTVDEQRAVARLSATRNFVHPDPTTGRIGGKSSTHSLAHSLCSRIQSQDRGNFHTRSRNDIPAPIDILEAVISACPELLVTPSTTPLSIALKKGAPPYVIDCLLIHDEPHRPSLFVKDGRGDTPLVQAVKHGSSQEVVQLLIAHDESKSSLLIPSESKKKIPLWYSAKQELASAYFHGCDEGQVPQELTYLLIQTAAALKLQTVTGNRITNNIPLMASAKPDARKASLADELDSSCSSGVDEPVEEHETSLALLRATISCAHFLDGRSLNKLLNIFIQGNWLEINTEREDEESLLHHICRATFNFGSPHETGSTTFLEFVLDKSPGKTREYNDEGCLPLHVALQTQQPWTVLEILLSADSTSIRVPTLSGQLPLHIALFKYPLVPIYERSNAIHEIWSRFPEASNVLDNQEKLFAFMIPVAKETSSQNKQAASQTVVLSTVFHFLRNSPEIIQLCTGDG